MHRLSLLALLLSASPCLAQGTKLEIRFSASMPSKLSGADLYVIDADSPVIVLASPLGLVSILEEAGPVKIRAKFVDGAKPETRTYKGKQVFLIEALATGTVELLIVPKSATATAEDAIRKTLQVEQGEGPRPPPPTENPVKHLTFVFDATPASAKVVNDQALRAWLKGKGIAVSALAGNDPILVQRGLDSAVKLAGGPPCIVLQDVKGNVLSQATLTDSVQVRKVVEEHMK